MSSSAKKFPTLHTGAVIQYHSDRDVIFRTAVTRFVDGSEQRYPQFAGPMLRWVIRLDLLNDAEAQSLVDFYSANEGGTESFVFTDPWTGIEYPNCVFEHDDLTVDTVFEAQSRTQLTIRSTRE